MGNESLTLKAITGKSKVIKLIDPQKVLKTKLVVKCSLPKNDNDDLKDLEEDKN